MADAPVYYVSRLLRLPVTEDDAVVAALADVVLGSPHGREAPAVIGFVVSVHRRRVFVPTAKVASLDASGLHLDAAPDPRPFSKRPGELLVAGDVFDARVAGGVVRDVGLRPHANRPGWEVASVALGGSGPLRRLRSTRVVDWTAARAAFDAGPVAGEVAALRELLPADVAAAVRRLPLERRRQLAEVMEDERLADLLEELPEDEQIRLIEGLDPERVAHVLEEMDPDDAADLLGELPHERQRELLRAMDPDEADPVRRLLAYGEHTAGGLMTSEPVVASPDTTVAEALALVREPELVASLAAQVFVAEPPTQTPTGRFLGVVGFQRLLREPPGTPLSRCIGVQPDPVLPGLGEAAVAERLAAYDLLAVPVCDREGRLLGAVTVDDVLDATLPADWRQQARAR